MFDNHSEELSCSKVASAALFDFDRLEQTLEVACSEALVVAALDNFKEQGRTIFHWLSENLK